MQTTFYVLDGGDKFIRVSEINTVSHTPVYRKLKNTVTLNLVKADDVVNAIQESTGAFATLDRDEEVILLTK